MNKKTNDHAEPTKVER